MRARTHANIRTHIIIISNCCAPMAAYAYKWIRGVEEISEVSEVDSYVQLEGLNFGKTWYNFETKNFIQQTYTNKQDKVFCPTSPQWKKKKRKEQKGKPRQVGVSADHTPPLWHWSVSLPSRVKPVLQDSCANELYSLACENIASKLLFTCKGGQSESTLTCSLLAITGVSTLYKKNCYSVYSVCRLKTLNSRRNATTLFRKLSTSL